MTGNNKIRPIAIYLPQFHPIAENDEWWGKGFTEWTNVTKAKALYKGHYQPQLPTDLGLYDLRCKETRILQANLAKQYGVEGFAYYHYWFNGKRLLDRPFNEVLHSGEPDFPFCLFWANETWSRRWLGEEKEILIKQEYSIEDDINHANYLVKAFSDKRYITINDRPVFIIYRPNDLPDVSATVNIIKEKCIEKLSVEPFLIASNSHIGLENNIMKYGFDAILNFRPQLGVLPKAFEDQFLYSRFKENLLKFKVFSGTLKIFNYREALELMKQIEPITFDDIIPSVFVGWDNSPRRKEKGIIMQGNTPAIFKEELERVAKKIQQSATKYDLLFINAWNEWAEGNNLEPNERDGLQFLEVIKNTFLSNV